MGISCPPQIWTADSMLMHLHPLGICNGEPSPEDRCPQSLSESVNRVYCARLPKRDVVIPASQEGVVIRNCLSFGMRK